MIKSIGIIPARYGSTRFPGKPLVDILGKTMIQRVYEQAIKSNLDSVIVATDDQRILDHVVSFGGKCEMTSDKHQSGTDRCAEVADKYNAEIIINIQGDEPLIEPFFLNQLLESFEDNGVEIATLIKPIEDSKDLTNSNRIKVVLDKDKNGIYFSRSPIPFYHSPDMNKWLKENQYYMHIGIYAFRKKMLESVVKLPQSMLEKCEKLEQLRWLENGYKIRTLLTDFNSHSIDSPEDLESLKKHINSV